jgi:DNA-binding response OmpR family regulator
MRQASVFLVEDEVLIGLLLTDMIEQLGHRVVAEAANIQDGQTLAQTAKYDLAVLDINIGGHSINPVAEIIDRRGLPFLFVSGYGSGGRPEQFSDRPLLQKPVMTWKLRATINSILSISDTEFAAGHTPRDRSPR